VGLLSTLSPYVSLGCKDLGAATCAAKDASTSAAPAASLSLPALALPGLGGGVAVGSGASAAGAPGPLKIDIAALLGKGRRLLGGGCLGLGASKAAPAASAAAARSYAQCKWAVCRPSAPGALLGLLGKRH
jgi:hypothetical protein